MANVIEILINAKNNASAEIDRATGGLGKFATAAGIGAAAGSMAGQAIMQAMMQAKDAVIGVTMAYTDHLETLQRMESTTGLTVNQLQVFRLELERDGLSADALGQSMRFFQEQIVTGKLAALGITSRDTFTALQQLAQKMEQTVDVQDRAELASTALGMRNAQLAATLARTATSQQAFNETLASGALYSADAKMKLADLDIKMDQFRRTQESLGIATATIYAPIIGWWIDLANKINLALQSVERYKSATARGIAGFFLGGDFKPTRPAAGGSAPGPQFGPLAFGPGNQSGINDMAAWALNHPTKRKPTLANFTESRGFEPNAIASALQRLVAYLESPQGALKSSMRAGGADGTLSGKEVSDPVTKAFSRVQEAAAQFGTNFAGSLSSTLTQALSITTSSTNLIVLTFTSLANSVVATLAEMMARAAAMGLVKLALSFIPTGGASVGAKIASTFGTSVKAGGGGNTFVIQSINTRDALDDLMNSTGSLRRANDRMRDISIAAMG